ncbi:30S ribosomal protein S1 [Alphaproteobacteria bacterium]|nr:30S ribosomal protein S1 [Alphaproteobacteria bacterium]MDB2479163.1 30S ribosomal protein S1 [Alphaproteobacteria bacterium]
MSQADITNTQPKESFAELLDQSFQEMTSIEGSVVTGTVLSIEKDMILIDVGLKSEGRVPIREFGNDEDEIKIKAGDNVEVFIERLEDANGQAILSREKARREESWVNLEKALEKQQRVNGVIFGKVKGGFTVDLEGATAFLPGSQVDIRPIKDLGVLMGTPQPFQILKMDRRRGNIVVSRRAVLEDSRAEARTELVANLEEGQVLQGVIKNITDYGAFVDLGGVDGLLHVTDISWKRINHPSEALQIGESVQVKVIKFNDETQRISLGIKQLTEDPWLKVFERFPIGSKMSGVVTNITDYGSFVELEDGIEGLVHVSEMSWTKKNVHPGKIVSTSEKVEVMILEIDVQKRRISLGIKQCIDNPWEKYKTENKIGDTIEGEIRNITEFGLFVALSEDIDGLVHLSDISWDGNGDELIKDFTKGTSVKAKILDIDIEKERISLGIKQLTEDLTSTELGNLSKGSIVTCTVSVISDKGLDVSVGDNISGFIKRNDLARERSDQKTERFGVGDKIDAMVTNIDKKLRKVSLSIKAKEIEEEKKVMEEYGSSDSGASLGDILGAALAKKDEDSSS